ncbi:DUF916 and DUF3324 domain-containing protein [Vagococcus xieshaowenii]|nr:DUF916 and DUF3324 domain-containing protein [Vagococcus xieshaowenii]
MKKICLLLITLFSSMVTAAEFVSASEFNFSVDTVLPNNQREGSTYYDLVMEPNKQQEIITKIKNHTNREIEVEVSIEPATTNINGVVDYSKTEKSVDETAPFNIKDYVKANEQTIKIPANETCEYKLKISMPKNKFNGIVAGGITFKELEEKKEKKEKSESQSMAIENKFAYSIALLLRQNEISLDSDLKLINVRPDQLNGRNVIYSDLQNPIAKYLNKLTVDAKLTKKGKNETLFEASNENMQMAPNTTMSFPIRLDGKKLEAGKYTMYINASSGENKWQLEKDFEITAERARELNKTDVSIEEDNSMLFIYIGIGILIVLMLIIIILLIKKKNKA